MPLCTFTSRVVPLALVTIVGVACSAVTTQAAFAAHDRTTTTDVPENAGVIQLRPVIPPKGVSLLTCPVGEALSTCTGSLSLASWKLPPPAYRRAHSNNNPPPDTSVTLAWNGTAANECFLLAPASYVLTTAASVNTNVGTLNGNPGIEITVPKADAPALDDALKNSFKKPLAIVADGQIVYILDVEPTGEHYQPMGGVLIFFATSSVNQRIASEISAP